MGKYSWNIFREGLKEISKMSRREGRAAVVNSLAKTEGEPFKGFKPLKGLYWLSTPLISFFHS